MITGLRNLMIDARTAILKRIGHPDEPSGHNQSASDIKAAIARGAIIHRDPRDGFFSVEGLDHRKFTTRASAARAFLASRGLET